MIRINTFGTDPHYQVRERNAETLLAVRDRKTIGERLKTDVKSLTRANSAEAESVQLICVRRSTASLVSARLTEPPVSLER
ncbi:hypothetical protein SAMN05444422_103248 [Halobiforma haloterrestris]|uniref:Uncharacterized protein n=1 Tax=Natronobacterium haloterrestre TaxID=148448 RepID=A0A1I1FAU2_NATHA|nr:hypothetical protein SAMN05444422_103248 [Halobiforma haloterrestris]